MFFSDGADISKFSQAIMFHNITYYQKMNQYLKFKKEAYVSLKKYIVNFPGLGVDS